jgi:hypothetical protein
VIVFADVVGYSRLMADDKPVTLNRWTALYRDVLKPEAERRRGQVCELRDDGTLLEFEQVADALEWSRLAHRAAAATGIGDTAPLALRVAIHQGTVFSTRDGLFGDAVNIAVPGGRPLGASLPRRESGLHSQLGVSHRGTRPFGPPCRGPSGRLRSDAPGTRIPACDLHTPAPAFLAARDWRSLPGRATRSRLAGLKKERG